MHVRQALAAAAAISAAAIVAAISAVPASAAIVSGVLTGGSAQAAGGVFTIIANPSGLVVGDDDFNNNDVRGFNEKSGFTLLSDLNVNAVVGSGPLTISAGTVVDSHYLNFDPLRSETVSGTVTFSSNILGVIWFRNRLQSSEFLGAPGVTYTYPSLVGFETRTDSFTLTTSSFQLTASSPGDSWRVITLADGNDPGGGVVPEPAGWAMMLAGFGLVGVGLRRRQTVFAA